MPLLAPEKLTTYDDLRVKLDTELLADLRVYCDQIQSAKEYVVTQALRRLFDDPEFRKLRAEKPELWTERNAGKARGRKAKATATAA